MSTKPVVHCLLCLLLERLNGSLVDATALVDEMSGGGGLAGVDMADDNYVDVEFVDHFSSENNMFVLREQKNTVLLKPVHSLDFCSGHSFEKSFPILKS